MEIVYIDDSVIVCVKPAGVLSTDEPGGLPELVRKELGDEKADVRTVHRLDRAVSGLMLLARGAKAASELSRQIREDEFEKQYMAVVHGETEDRASLRDLLLRNKARKMTFVVTEPEKGVQEALLDYETLARRDNMSLVRIHLHTGRTHQIRVQFSSRGFPLYGDKKYGLGEGGGIALWSARLQFTHPKSGQEMDISKAPDTEKYPWSEFEKELMI